MVGVTYCISGGTRNDNSLATNYFIHCCLLDNAKSSSVAYCHVLHIVSNSMEWCCFRDKQLFLRILEFVFRTTIGIIRSGGPRVSGGVQEVTGTQMSPKIFLVWANVRILAPTVEKSGESKGFNGQI